MLGITDGVADFKHDVFVQVEQHSTDLAGFDNIPSGEYMIPPLTTVEQPRGEIAEALIAELFASLRDPAHNAFIPIPCRLVVREST